MTKEELMLTVVPEMIFDDDNWGFGQIDIDTILVMIEVGKEIGLAFTLVKKVIAMDFGFEEEECRPRKRTIVANKDHLFVFPSDNRECGPFWNEVRRRKQREVIPCFLK